LKATHVDKLDSQDKVGGVFEGGTVSMKTLIDEHVGAEQTMVAVVTFPPAPERRYTFTITNRFSSFLTAKAS
jgi:hypothetical protein